MRYLNHILLVTDRASALSAAIRWFSRAPKYKDRKYIPSHTAIIRTKKVVYEAFVKVGEGLRSRYQDPEDHRKVYRIKSISPERIERAFQKMRQETEGQFYGVGQLLGSIRVGLCRKLGINSGTPWKRRNVCSEIVWRFLYHLGGSIRRALLKFFPQKDVFWPIDEDWLLEQLPQWFEVIEWPA